MYGATITQAQMITREEFGLALFDMIRMISGLDAIREHLSVAIHKEQRDTLPALQARYDALHAAIAAALPKLSPADCDAILERYPMVAHL